MPMQPCKYCDGEGKVTMEWGVGWHTTPSGKKVTVSPIATEPAWTEESCPECKGEGEIEVEEEEE